MRDPEKTRQPVASSDTIPTSKNPGATPLGINPGLPRWEVSPGEPSGSLNVTAPSWCPRPLSALQPNAVALVKAAPLLLIPVVALSGDVSLSHHSGIPVVTAFLNLLAPTVFVFTPLYAILPFNGVANKVNQVQSTPGSLDSRKWESCRTMVLVGGISRGYPVSPAPSFRHRSIFTLSPSLALKTSLLRAAQISSLTSPLSNVESVRLWMYAWGISISAASVHVQSSSVVAVGVLWPAIRCLTMDHIFSMGERSHDCAGQGRSVTWSDKARHMRLHIVLLAQNIGTTTPLSQVLQTEMGFKDDGMPFVPPGSMFNALLKLQVPVVKFQWQPQ
ncbi:hypothetical protein PR048_014027 [Dryococelus australis]|uniref:Uncharacterized protein n=1 Tax=Dryococelus australis TaxID=614101 RepID=A0ABQ9HTV4_9NEOP|nr:hypothetical protein PR048_014027 [Dryococelus australis]